ncbi:hypothetical protein TPHA_0J02400 [Tetrapisispora phaffii CBS 4417]|uniref:SCA7 domain-containing protein n=1 Tax=Tetrapisispora phaffii (strain ATCC 24235 / CBS 4417 / NBRC 1672 / NRRL Y-8282 / UCD 70-5) TaxID=1071381 RepID=G8BYW8_TETPH|nr:hypothetical protein TPHA_0J02400 [Tetrapisispora phaffii CBS 4417]CCE65060.1 hypothetical protein TPHA_0J02400 [Tetrapisispora phaffii CBS 4417]
MMSNADAIIKGFKDSVVEKYPNIISNTQSNENDSEKNASNPGWKQLLGKVKNAPLQYDHVDLKKKEKFFNSNTHFIDNGLATNNYTNYRLCNACGKPISIEVIMDHLKTYCSKLQPSYDKAEEVKPIAVEEDDNSRNNKIEEEDMNDDDYDDNDDDDNDRKRTANDLDESTPGTPMTSSKKQRVSGSRKPRKVKQRNPTDKHLINFDKQCGVGLPEGGYCARSLTCKSHSMGAKRAVEGRTQDYDLLLAEYHKIHQTKIGAAAEKRARQTTQKPKEPKQPKERKAKQKKARGKPSKKKEDNNSQSADALAADMVILTPEEETTQVLNGISRSYPLPLESTVLTSVRRRTKYFRMREMFASSFSIKTGYTSPGYGPIQSRVGCVDIEKPFEYKFRIKTPQPNTALQQQQNLVQQQRQRSQQQMLLMQQQQQQQQQQRQQQQQQQQQRQAMQQQLQNNLNAQ